MKMQEERRRVRRVLNTSEILHTYGKLLPYSLNESCIYKQDLQIWNIQKTYPNVKTLVSQQQNIEVVLKWRLKKSCSSHQ